MLWDWVTKTVAASPGDRSMKRRESRKFSILAGVIVSVLWSGLALSAETLQKIRFAIASRSNIVAPKHIAISKGFFKAEGLGVELIQMNPRLSATALVNEDVSYADAFTSTFRAMMQGFPIKLVLVHQKKAPYFLITRPEIKDIQQIKGRKLGVATLRGSDHLAADELMLSKGFNPAGVQPIVIGDAAGLHAQAEGLYGVGGAPGGQRPRIGGVCLGKIPA